MARCELHVSSATTDTPARRAELAADGGMTVEEVERFLTLGTTAVYQLMDAGEIAWAKCGRRRVVSRRSVTEYLATRLVGG